MFNDKIVYFGLGLLLLTACTQSNKDFAQAVAKAQSDGLTHANAAQSGVPFYANKTLDPTWDVNSSIVKINKISLLNQNGEAISENYFDKKITVLAFFFSNCSGFCPTTLKNLAQVEERLKGFTDMQYTGISVDPEHDQPKKLQKYFTKLKLNNETWNLLTGDREVIYNFARETVSSELFKYQKKKGQIAHSEQFYVFDSERRLRGMFKGTRIDTPEKIFELVSQLRGLGTEAKKVTQN